MTDVNKQQEKGGMLASRSRASIWSHANDVHFATRVIVLLVALFVTPTVLFADEPKFTRTQIEYFEREIRPLLVKNCYACHSHKAKKLQAKLYLDSRAGMLKGGDSGAAIVPGKADESLMIEAIRYESLEMPPKRKLPKETVEKFVKWIKMGAPWPKEAAPSGVAKTEPFDWKKRKAAHWSWKPLADVQPPAVKNKTWPINNIDRFILARLEQKGLSPAKVADKRTLIRRVYFDLIGLPPSPKEVADFLSDTSPNAYERVVDRLLKSQHFGEKWGRHWLDLVRYAETHGHEFDYPIRHAYRYRDYVIRAFNEDVPYNQFATEHIAGDLLAKPRRHPDDRTNQSVIATAFWYFGDASHSPTDVKGDESRRIDNMIDAFSKTFLGLTVSCARCHDHKFDPIPTTDYYAISGFLQGTRKQEALLDPGGKISDAVGQIDALRAQASKLKPKETGSIAAYLLAAREAWTTDPLNKATHGGFGKSPRPDVVFEDFEQPVYRGWKVSGSAFGKGPVTGKLPRQQHVFGFKGKRLVNSYHGGDGARGTLTSRDFKIERDYINLLVGGGIHKGTTCVNLIVDGKVTHTAIGKGNDDDEKLSPRSWDVRSLQGRTARIQIVDRQRGRWGHINVDHIVFSDEAATDVSLEGMPKRGVIAYVAKKNKLDEAQLTVWLRALADPAAQNPTHPFYVWAKLLKVEPKKAAGSWRGIAADLKTRDARALHSQKETKLLADFADGGKSWFATGWAFSQAQQPNTTIRFDGAKPRRVLPTMIDSGTLGKRAQGAIRSPTFELSHRDIFLRVRSSGAVTFRLIIDGYQMEPFNGLLFGGTRITGRGSDTRGQWKWLRMGNDMYRGHKAYLEVLDDGGSEIAVDEVRLSNGVTPQDRPAEVVRQSLQTDGSYQQLAASYAKYADAVLKSWRKLAGEQAAFADFLLKHELLDLPAALKSLGKKAEQIERGIPSPQRVLAVCDGSGEDEHVFIRGNHRNLGKPVARRMLIAIGGEEQPAIKTGSGRLELAKRVTDPANPFVTRVLVNRLWHHLFGKGIVPTVDDFGKMGLPPSHPGLLDWLAKDFIANGWSMKRAIRQMVLSQTYRMSSRVESDSRASDVDPTNSLLHRMRVRRLTAEQLRDAILSASGRLDRRIGGPSVDVYLTPFMQGRGRPRSGPVDGASRRSLYLAIRRNFLSPMMLAFDFPVPFSSMGRRTVSNVPAQALILMNDPFVKQQAELWAKNLQSVPETETRISQMFDTAFGRPPSAAQKSAALAFVKQQSALYAGNENAPQLWADLAHTMFNMKEFLFLR